MNAAVGAGSGVYAAELAREVEEFCRRMLGDGEPAREAARSALSGGPERVAALGRAARACREGAEAVRRHSAAGPAGTLAPPPPPPPPPAADGDLPGQLSRDFAELDLSARVSREVAAANRALPERQREAIALREHLRLSHAQISLAIGIDVAAVAGLLARARLALGAELRGRSAAAAVEGACVERERALRVLARRQDSEALDGADDDWIMRHVGECEECARTHAAMLEASVRYRAWKRGR